MREYLPFVDVNWLPIVQRKTTSEVERDYWRYRGVIDGDVGLPADVSADVVNDVVDLFAQEVH